MQYSDICLIVLVGLYCPGTKIVYFDNCLFFTSFQREVVEQLLLEQSTSYAIISDNIKKVYPRRDGNPEKFAVQGLSLAVPHGECFGMLGPNGAGKTSFINMVSDNTVTVNPWIMSQYGDI